MDQSQFSLNSISELLKNVKQLRQHTDIIKKTTEGMRNCLEPQSPTPPKNTGNYRNNAPLLITSEEFKKSLGSHSAHTSPSHNTMKDKSFLSKDDLDDIDDLFSDDEGSDDDTLLSRHNSGIMGQVNFNSHAKVTTKPKMPTRSPASHIQTMPQKNLLENIQKIESWLKLVRDHREIQPKFAILIDELVKVIFQPTGTNSTTRPFLAPIDDMNDILDNADLSQIRYKHLDCPDEIDSIDDDDLNDDDDDIFKETEILHAVEKPKGFIANTESLKDTMNVRDGVNFIDGRWVSTNDDDDDTFAALDEIDDAAFLGVPVPQESKPKSVNTTNLTTQSITIDDLEAMDDDYVPSRRPTLNEMPSISQKLKQNFNLKTLNKKDMTALLQSNEFSLGTVSHTQMALINGGGGLNPFVNAQMVVPPSNEYPEDLNIDLEDLDDFDLGSSNASSEKSIPQNTQNYSNQTIKITKAKRKTNYPCDIDHLDSQSNGGGSEHSFCARSIDSSRSYSTSTKRTESLISSPSSHSRKDILFDDDDLGQLEDDDAYVNDDFKKKLENNKITNQVEHSKRELNEFDLSTNITSGLTKSDSLHKVLYDPSAVLQKYQDKIVAAKIKEQNKSKKSRNKPTESNINDVAWSQYPQIVQYDHLIRNAVDNKWDVKWEWS